jgi:signal transduction histidine kinase
MASLGALTSGIAHEINEPLNEISGGLSMLEEDLPGKKSTESARSMIRQGIGKAHKILKALMTFSGRDTETPVPSDLHEIIDNTLLLISSRLGEHIRIEKEYRVKRTIPVFPDKLHQLLWNIIDNAIFAIQEKEQFKDESIRISTWELPGRTAEEGRAVIEICNSGPAIPDQIISQVFDPFFTTKDPGEATGLGLSISHSLVQEHNGTIEVHNVPDGVCFVIKLPVSAKS